MRRLRAHTKPSATKRDRSPAGKENLKFEKGELRWWEPRPEGRGGANYAKGSAGAGASSARDESLGVVEVSADRDLGLEPFGFLSM